MSRPHWDDYFLGIAEAVARRADCTRRRVGCVMVDRDHRVISTGYNGAVAGDPGCLSGACPRGQLSYADLPKDAPYNNCIAVHAEANALLYARASVVGATAYITDQPCPDCTKLLRGAGVTRWITPTTRITLQ